MQKFVGTITEENGNKLDVWVETFPTGEIEVVYVLDGDRQLADFPFGKPTSGCELSDAAQAIAAAPQLRNISLPLLVMSE